MWFLINDCALLMSKLKNTVLSSSFRSGCYALIGCRLEAAEGRVLNFFMEFINWKTLPYSMLRITSYRRSTGRWKPRKHFGKVD